MPKRRKTRQSKKGRARRGALLRRRRAAALQRAKLARATTRSRAAYKGQITRLKRQLAAAREGAVAGAGECVIFQSSADDAEPVFKPIDAWGALSRSGARWLADLVWIQQGVTLEQERLPFPPEWEAEALGATLRRQAKAWIDAQKVKHPELGGESPAAGIVRLALASGT